MSAKILPALALGLLVGTTALASAQTRTMRIGREPESAVGSRLMKATTSRSRCCSGATATRSSCRPSCRARRSSPRAPRRRVRFGNRPRRPFGSPRRPIRRPRRLKSGPRIPPSGPSRRQSPGPLGARELGRQGRPSIHRLLLLRSAPDPSARPERRERGRGFDHLRAVAQPYRAPVFGVIHRGGR